MSVEQQLRTMMADPEPDTLAGAVGSIDGYAVIRQARRLRVRRRAATGVGAAIVAAGIAGLSSTWPNGAAPGRVVQPAATAGSAAAPQSDARTVMRTADLGRGWSATVRGTRL